MTRVEQQQQRILMQWKLPFGSSVESDGIRFRIWAPDARQVSVVIEGDAPTCSLMQRGTGGFHHAFVAGVGAGTRYRFSLDGELVPDPASRSQPDGVCGASEAIAVDAFAWSDDAWPGVRADDLVIYELHIGTFTLPGTFDAAIQRLDDLAKLGVTAIELMPVAGVAGTRNWGYDGVALFAPSVTYGGPHGLKRFVDAAHRRGLGVILDVVYNHFGPEGNYLPSVTGGRIFNPRHQTPWGSAVNFDGPWSAPVRDFVLQNALYWAHEYHVDGLRLDAAHAMVDESPVHIVREIAGALHGLERPRLVMAEDDRNERRLVLPASESGFGLDAVWADDLHHQLRRFVAGDRDAYFRSFGGTMSDVVETLRRGWFFEGQWSDHHSAPRGTPAADLSPRAFVHCIQNHDQIGNRALGDRLHESITLAEYRVLSALLLTSPYTPLLFMGQEWAASSPFQFFTDFPGELGALVTAGRQQEFAEFSAFRASEERSEVPDPQAEETFLRSRLRWSERAASPHAQILALYEALLELRRSSPALRRRERGTFAVEALSDDTMALRREAADGRPVVFLAQFGNGTHWLGADHPLLALPAGEQWSVVLDTEDARFGGDGGVSTISETGAVLLRGVGGVILATARVNET
jgi:maltooligosyltrehalose trehalohydrolase